MRIAVMVHERDRKFTPNYVAAAMLKHWRHAGHEVEIVAGPHTPDSDVLLPHVDCTVLPRAYRSAIARHSCVINRQVHNISKSRISSMRVRTPWRDVGPVIVKTDMNSGGRPEYHKRTRLRKRMERRERRLGPDFEGLLVHSRYRVFESNRDVPAMLYLTRGLVVERFIPERFGDLYGVRYYRFLGDRETAYLYRSFEPIVKRENCEDRTRVEVPPDLRRIRESLGLDYGKIDYVMHDGSPVVFDVTATPGYARAEEREIEAALFAGGIEGLVERLTTT